MLINFHIAASAMAAMAIPIVYFFLWKLKSTPKTALSSSDKLPKSYPIIGSILSIWKNQQKFVQWTSEIVTSTPTLTFLLRHPFGRKTIFTANPAVVRHILKSNFKNYSKGEAFRGTLRDFLGDGIFNSDGEMWKFQRQIAIHEFKTKSLWKFVENVVDSMIAGRLIPVMENAAAAVLDLQDVLHRLGFDNICKIAFGYDPGHLSPSPSLPPVSFAAAFEKAMKLSGDRFQAFFPYLWKIKKALNVGSERELKIAVGHVRESAIQIVRAKKEELFRRSNGGGDGDGDGGDLLSRFLSSGHTDEEFVTDIVISFILAGRDSTSAVLTWFFWLLSRHRRVEEEVVGEIENTSGVSAYEEVKEMVYTHASLCETMRLYPPIPMDPKTAQNNDVLPDGTVVEKGAVVVYHPYAMGRAEAVWGKDWAEFRPERWLERDAGGGGAGKWRFVGKDEYSFPVFQGGPRICLGKDMAFIQMKRVVAAVLRRFRVVPVAADGAEPVFIQTLTARMEDGLPVRLEARVK
ncbi:cytochrome P450 94A2-like [Andrographis paniculata]|uniref:cytochrome P450 94A2-like n=1 Tax=Andrographis paniculata TaxID=175694 RepID=UPI0021E89EE5|nr:cytochrome P450 94A2-like [Andrographis paniculata]